jgi:hypothetical protein
MFQKIQTHIPEATSDAAATEVVKPTLHSDAESQRRSEKLANVAEAVNRLLKFYPPLDGDDPETFITGIIAVLAEYPLELVEIATVPGGIPKRLKYLNNLAAIREICDELFAPMVRARHRQHSSLLLPSRVVPRAERPSYDELKAKYPPNWGSRAPPE